MIVKVSKLNENATIPEYKTEGAAGFDLCACYEFDGGFCLRPNTTTIIPTGLSFEVPSGYEMQIRPRSGLAAKNGITVLNSPGTIDSDYRGEVKIILTNLGNSSFTIKNGDRIAQGVICPVIRAEFREEQKLQETKRGDGGFGSTGV